jgi:hypothetical protein
VSAGNGSRESNQETDGLRMKPGKPVQQMAHWKGIEKRRLQGLPIPAIPERQ